MNTALGFACLILGALANGTFGVMHRQAANISNEIFVLYCITLGLMPVCLLTATLLPALQMTFGFTGWGLLSGFLCSILQHLVFTLIGRLGVALAIGVCAAGSVLVGVAADVIFFDRRPTSIGTLLLALFLVTLGIVIIVVSHLISLHPSSDPGDQPQELASDEEDGREKGGQFVGSMLQHVNGEGPNPEQLSSDAPSMRMKLARVPTAPTLRRRNALVIGVCVLISPLLIVALNAVQMLAPEELRGLAFNFSFGIGAGTSTLVFTIPIFVVTHGRCPTALDYGSARDVRFASYSGMLLGFTFACMDLGLGFGVSLGIANTVVQGSIFLAGLWGIVLYNEIQGAHAIQTFCVGVTVMFFGIALEATTRI